MVIYMYSEQDRNEVFNYLVEKFKQRNEVLSIIQIGSGAIGYRDKYSDLDFAIVVDDTDIDKIFKKTQDDINEKYNVFFFNNMEERKLQLFLLDNYLELDIGYYTLGNLYARRENYKVIFDKTNQVEDIMKKSWLEIKEKNKGSTQKVDMKEVISFIDSELWYNVLHSVIAFNRGNKYRCYYELEQIKWYAMDLIAKRNNKESKRYRSIVELDKIELDKIDFLFIYPTNYEELSNYLNKALNIIFEEFDFWKNKEDILHIGNIDFYKRFIEQNK